MGEVWCPKIDLAHCDAGACGRQRGRAFLAAVRPPRPSSSVWHALLRQGARLIQILDFGETFDNVDVEGVPGPLAVHFEV